MMTRWVTALSVAVVLLAPPATAFQRVRVSPHETHTFTVDGADLTFNYGRPSKKGRAIWGSLVPWGRWWMPGADEATILTTTAAIAIGPLSVPAGDHTLYMWPDEKTSRFIVSNEVGQFHTQYHPDRDLGRIDYEMRKVSEPVEQLTYTAEVREGGGGLIKLSWDDREYSVAFVVKK